MKKQILLCFCWLILSTTISSATDYQCESFIINSDLDPRFVQFIRANAEAYFKNIKQLYFSVSLRGPFQIYYSRTQSDTQELLNQHGHRYKVGSGHYADRIPALYSPNVSVVYSHQIMDNGRHTTWGELFHEITHHFIRLNYDNPPAWLKEGLASFLGEQTRIVNKRITVGRPVPWREQILRDKIKEGIRPNIKRLFSTSDEQFYNWDVGCHFARAFFYWLHVNGYLKDYLKNVQRKGYELSTLEETVSQSYGGINIELLRFIRQHCYAGAYLQDSRQAEDQIQREQALLKALELKPDYNAAQLEFAKCCYNSKNYQRCRENLKQILDDPECIEYRQAVTLLGSTYYDEKNYAEAIRYYKIGWKYSDYHEYKYRLAYKIANCYHHLKNYLRAKDWYKTFLDCRWEPESMRPQADYALKYTQRFEDNTNAEQTEVRVNPADKREIKP
ncbi:MAG: tetratricopeptide repeat protein [Planctomycetota bacterium]|nr:MAG: tetratricopeptide repeat protein [Planctomycetota bacterium]